MSDADVSSLTRWFYSILFNSVQDFPLKGNVSVFVFHRVKKKKKKLKVRASFCWSVTELI